MRRREFIAGLGSAAAWPLVAQAQQGDRVRRMRVLRSLADLVKRWIESRRDPLVPAD